MRFCSTCGFILGTRPGLLEKDGVCQACINSEKKKTPEYLAMFADRQSWLTQYITDNKTNNRYDCVIAVSGGKDSHMIVRRLIENHGVKNPLLVSVTDEFTHTEAGKNNITNLVTKYDLDLITFRCKPKTFKRETKNDFLESLHPLKWIESQIYKKPVEIAKKYGIKLVFFGENSAFEYGTSEELEIFHPESDEETKIIFLGSIYPYSISDSLKAAREIGFKDLDEFREWEREGSIEQFTQIDSVGYIIQLWTKFVKYGFQRVSDIACRFVREGKLTKEQAAKLITEHDYKVDPEAKMDFCKTIGLTPAQFDDAVDMHANPSLVCKDAKGRWKRIEALRPRFVRRP